MIQRIRPSEYLSDIQAMTEGERKNYLKRVGEWLADGGQRLLQMTDRPMAKAQNIVQLSTRWTKEDCEAFREGALLMTALTKVSDTWLPSQLYARSANRAVRRIVECFGEAVQGSGFRVQGQPAGKPTGTVATQQTKKPAAEATGTVTKMNAAEATGTGTNTSAVSHQPSTITATPVRPKHIDQYVHLLPQKTQERAATVKGLLRDLDMAREKMRLLMDDPKASADSRAQWAKTATTLDEKVKGIYKELDAEWEKLVQSGRVVVDDLGNARVMEPAVAQQGTQPDGDQVQQDAEQANAEAEAKAAEEKAKRIEYLKKWLRDSRTKPSDERRKQWEVNCKELLSLGGEITDSIRKAGEVYGVAVDTLGNGSSQAPQN